MGENGKLTHEIQEDFDLAQAIRKDRGQGDFMEAIIYLAALAFLLKKGIFQNVVTFVCRQILPIAFAAKECRKLVEWQRARGLIDEYSAIPFGTRDFEDLAAIARAADDRYRKIAGEAFDFDDCCETRLLRGAFGNLDVFETPSRDTA